MKQLDTVTNPGSAPEECASLVLQVVPQVMRAIRAELRDRADAALSVTQFRTLAYLAEQSGGSLSDLADHIGLALPSMSKLVDGLVARELVTREEDPNDRRRVVLCLTAKGRQSVQRAFSATQAQLSQRLQGLTPEQREAVACAMIALRPIFVSKD